MSFEELYSRKIKNKKETYFFRIIKGKENSLLHGKGTFIRFQLFDSKLGVVVFQAVAKKLFLKPRSLYMVEIRNEGIGRFKLNYFLAKSLFNEIKKFALKNKFNSITTDAHITIAKPLERRFGFKKSPRAVFRLPYNPQFFTYDNFVVERKLNTVAMHLKLKKPK